METQINIIKAIHEGLYDSIKGKTLRLNKAQKMILNSNKRISIIPKRRGVI